MLDHYLLLSVVCFLGMVSPGPDFVLVTKNSLIYPRSQALATAFGIVTGCTVHSTYCVLGLALVITKSVVLFSTIKYAGAFYLMYLGVRGVCSKMENTPDLESKTAPAVSIRTAYVEGLLCNLLNPKLAVFLLSLFTQFVPVEASFFDKAGVGVVFLLESVFYWPLLVVSLQRDFVMKFFVKARTSLDRVFGGMLLLLGLRVAFTKS